MNRKRLHKIQRKLDDFYKSIPVSIHCKGLCQESCGPIAMSEVEFKRISKLSKTIPTVNETGTCSLLVGGKCSVYDIRPTICRLWGMSEAMECPFGCVPTPRILNKFEGFRILDKVDEITGRGIQRSTMLELEEVLNSAKSHLRF